MTGLFVSGSEQPEEPACRQRDKAEQPDPEEGVAQVPPHILSLIHI